MYKNQEGKQRSSPHPSELEQKAEALQQGKIPMPLLEVTQRAETG